MNTPIYMDTYSRASLYIIASIAERLNPYLKIYTRDIKTSLEDPNQEVLPQELTKRLPYVFFFLGCYNPEYIYAVTRGQEDFPFKIATTNIVSIKDLSVDLCDTEIRIAVKKTNSMVIVHRDKQGNVPSVSMHDTEDVLFQLTQKEWLLMCQVKNMHPKYPFIINDEYHGIVPKGRCLDAYYDSHGNLHHVRLSCGRRFYANGHMSTTLGDKKRNYT